MLQGDLAIFSLGEIFQSLAINNHTGTLKIHSPGQQEKSIYFLRGEITYFSGDSPSARVPRLGEILVRMQLVTSADLDEALAEQRESRKLLGQLLVDKGRIGEDDLKAAITTKTLEGLYDVFLLKTGTFEFHMGEVPKEVLNDPEGKCLLSLNTSSVIMEGLRQIDEWALIQKKVKSFDDIYLRVGIPEGDPGSPSTALLDQLDGNRPVRDLFVTFPGSRFECCKALCDLLEKGHIRPLTEQECLERAEEKLRDRQYSQAADFLQFASSINPDRAETHSQLGDALSSLYQDDAARAAYVRAIQILHANEDYQGVAGLSDRLLPRISFEDPELEKIFYSYLRVQNFKRAAATGNLLVSSLQKKEDFVRAAAVLEAIGALAPRDLNLKIQVAGLFEKAGDKARATALLEEVAGTLEREKKLRELHKVLRLHVAVDPGRQDLKQKLAAVQALQEKIARRKRYGVTIAGGLIIALLVGTLLPLVYELKAREFFSHAERLEQISMLSMDFRQAKEAYLALVKNYSFSTKVAEAQVALERISTVERSLFEKMEGEAAARKLEQEVKLAALREELGAALHEAEAAEKAGDIQKSHEIYKRVTVDYAEVTSARNVLLPLRVTTYPAGATVAFDGIEAGVTPFIHRYKPGMTVRITVARASCEPIERWVELNDQWELRFTLTRRPLGELQAAPAIEQPMVLSAGRLVFPSRDGNLYAVDPLKKSVLWHRVVGRFGDRISDVSALGDEVYVGTVTGEVTAIAAATGRSRWIAKLGGSMIAAPVASPDGKWVAAGSTSGTVHLLANADGSEAARLATENEVIARPLFAGDLLIAGSTDDHVYGFSLSRLEKVAEAELTGDVALDLAGDGQHVIACTADGAVHRLEVPSLAVGWSRALGRTLATPACPSALGIHVGTRSGQVVTLERETGDVAWEVSAGEGQVTGLVLRGPRLYASLATGKVAAVDIEGRRVAWEYSSGMPIASPPLLWDGNLYLGGSTGTIQYVEVFE
ncbi:MAG: PQQ-binding-like beta-propeller repeat protein [Planctomycetes bacterium]|nr:PQQ-binding-like beta-propeller repeat protein [Planctomycetota bacterium]